MEFIDIAQGLLNDFHKIPGMPFQSLSSSGKTSEFPVIDTDDLHKVIAGTCLRLGMVAKYSKMLSFEDCLKKMVLNSENDQKLLCISSFWWNHLLEELFPGSNDEQACMRE